MFGSEFIRTVRQRITPWLFDRVLTLAGVVTLRLILLLIILERLTKLSFVTLLSGPGIYAAFLTTVLVTA